MLLDLSIPVSTHCTNVAKRWMGRLLLEPSTVTRFTGCARAHACTHAHPRTRTNAHRGIESRSEGLSDLEFVFHLPCSDCILHLALHCLHAETCPVRYLANGNVVATVPHSYSRELMMKGGRDVDATPWNDFSISHGRVVDWNEDFESSRAASRPFRQTHLSAFCIAPMMTLPAFDRVPRFHSKSLLNAILLSTPQPASFGYCPHDIGHFGYKTRSDSTDELHDFFALIISRRRWGSVDTRETPFAYYSTCALRQVLFVCRVCVCRRTKERAACSSLICDADERRQGQQQQQQQLR
jgi:hypothetical protein